MKEMENHLLGYLSIFDSWLKLYKAPLSRSVSHFQVKTDVGIFTHLRLSWLESPENNIKGIKSLSQIENKAWSVTVGKFLQPVKLNRSGFFLSINSSVNLLIYSRKMRHVLHAIMEILRNILPHPQQWQKIKNIEGRQYNVYNDFESSNESLRFTFFHCS